MIDCEDCSKFAYQLDPGEGQGKRILNGDQPIPVRCPPCHDDDKVCPKVRPGHSDLTETAQDIYDDWRLSKALDEPPVGPWAKFYHRMLDRLVESLDRERAERSNLEMAAMLRSLRRQ